MFLVVAAWSIRQVLPWGKIVFRPIALLLAFAISFFFVQILIHGESITQGNMRVFIPWILGVIIVHSLCSRPGFSFRFPLVLFVIGIATLPFLTFSQSTVDMARIDLAVQGGLTHPAGLAEWFGFCAVFFAISGLETERGPFRIGAWCVAVGCLLVVTLTAERGPLLATAMAITVGFRRALKRSFVPVLTLVIFVGVIAVSGLFEQALSRYAERGMEETGREMLWPAGIERIFTSPWVGVGESNVNISVSPDRGIPPHNVFLHFALSSGVIPFVFFVAFWIQAARVSFLHSEDVKDGSYRMPYLVFTFVVAMFEDLGFMSAWGIFAMSVAAGSYSSYRRNRLFLRRRIRSRHPEPFT